MAFPQLIPLLNGVSLPDFEQREQLLKKAQEAHSVIKQFIKPSPLRYSRWLSQLIQGHVWLKLENLNPTGSFKLRGGLYAIYKALEALPTVPHQKKSLKICAASAGNHAQGIAFAAAQMNCEAHIFLPKRTPMVKRIATENLGASVYLVGENLDEAFAAALEFAKTQGAHLVHAYNDENVILGQSSIVPEILEQLAHEIDSPNPPRLDACVMSVGGGGLLSGASFVFKHLKPDIKMWGAEQEHFDSAHHSLTQQQQKDIRTPGGSTIADGIAIRRIGNLNFEFLKRYCDGVTLVNDDDLVGAVLGLCEKERVVSEGAGAAAVAALLKQPAQFKNKNVVAVVSGGNIDPQLLSRVIARGLCVTGRILRLTVKVQDRPGQLRHLLEHVAHFEANVLEVHHDRTYSQVNVGDVEVYLALETRNLEQQNFIIERLQVEGFKPKVQETFGI